MSSYTILYSMQQKWKEFFSSLHIFPLWFHKLKKELEKTAMRKGGKNRKTEKTFFRTDQIEQRKI